MPQLLTPSDVAEVLRISTRAVQELMARGELPSSNVTVNPNASKPRRRVSVKDLEEFLRSRQSPVVAPVFSTPACVGHVVDRY
jgi:hypothetical protein